MAAPPEQMFPRDAACGSLPRAREMQQDDAGLKHLYIVEDDTAVRSALCMLAGSYGWSALAFAGGREFLQALVNEHSACLVLDLNMPKMDGEEVLRHLRARGSHLPVLVVSGDAPAARCERLLRAGAQEVLLKPFSDLAFYQAVQACWRRRGSAGAPT